MQFSWVDMVSLDSDLIDEDSLPVWEFLTQSDK